EETNCHGDKWRPLNPKRHVVVFFQDLVIRQSEQCTFPEFAIIVAEEVADENNTSKQSSRTQNEEWNQHYRRRIMNMFHNFCRSRSEEHTSELQSRENLVCRLLLEKKKT